VFEPPATEAELEGRWSRVFALLRGSVSTRVKATAAVCRGKGCTGGEIAAPLVGGVLRFAAGLGGGTGCRANTTLPRDREAGARRALMRSGDRRHYRSGGADKSTKSVTSFLER
jgi:hypothetical protein